jgi:hypothetical protein
MVAGDSVTVQAAVYGSDYVGAADTQNTIGLGWKAATANPGIRAAVYNPDRSPETLAVAFGMNDRDGNLWDTSERNAMFADVFTPDPAAKVVLVLPWALDNDAHDGPRYPEAVADIRDGLVRLADARNGLGSRTVVVDWRPIVEADPAVLGPDGVHLNTATPETAAHAANAYGGMMAAGAEA